MKLTDDQIDTLVLGVAKTRDDDLDEAAASPRARALFEQIVSMPPHEPVAHVDQGRVGPSRRTRRRRTAVFAAAGALLLIGGSAAASLLFSTEEQATADIECYQPAAWGGGSVGQEPAVGQDPVAFCRRYLGMSGRTVPPLVACAGDGTVAVIPGDTPAACGRAGFDPLGAGYDRYRAKVARLQSALLALEARVDCLPPAEFAARVQQLLDRTGWDGWTARLRKPDDGFPCGAVTVRGGGISRTLAGALKGKERVVLVRSSWSHSVDDLLYGARNGVFLPLLRRSGTRCFTTAELTALVDRAVSPAGLRTRVVVGHLGANTEIEGPRGVRYEAGCSIITMLQPAKTAGIVDLTISRKP
jgi:hypothetical protein